MSGRGSIWVCLICGVLIPSARAEEFDQIDGRTLLRALGGPEATAKTSLTVAEIGAMPALLRDTRSALMLARTDRGNPARMLVVPELRKPADGKGEPIPVIVLERLDAFDAGDPSTRLAHARDLVLYDGFRVDLDAGHVVPEGQGEDLVFRAGGDGGPRLEAVGPDARMVTVAKAPDSGRPKAARPTPGRAVMPGDFAGRYRLYANGQWSGSLDLAVEAGGVVTGRFASDLQGTTYPVTGQVAADQPGKLLFAVAVPRARLEFDGFLFGEGKGAMAGTVALLDRTFGFFAVREGGRVAPGGSDVEPLAPDETHDEAGRHVVEIKGEGITLDGKAVAADALPGALRAVAQAEPDAGVLVVATPDQPWSAVWRVVTEVRGAGIGSVRVAPISPGGKDGEPDGRTR